MKICPECGYECENDAIRCINCNTNVTGQPQQEPQPTVEPQYTAPQPQYTAPQQPQYTPPQYTPEPPYYQQQPQTVIVNNYTQPVSRKSKVVALLLCFFLGYLGLHRFYVGKIGTGVLWIFTGGCFGIGIIVDFIVILCGNFTDASGMPLEI